MSKPPLTVRCPTCGLPAVYAAENAYRPFCSERCRNTDLGAWASERYRVADRQGDPEGVGAAPATGREPND